MAKGKRCIACKRTVTELPEHRWGVGPVCIPCFFAAKLKYENGTTQVDDLPPEWTFRLMELFHKAGNSWPFDLIDRWQNVDFEKIAKDPRRVWWFERTEEGLRPATKLY